MPGDIRDPSLPLAKVHSNDRLLTRCGAFSATCSAMRPPIECPTT